MNRLAAPSRYVVSSLILTLLTVLPAQAVVTVSGPDDFSAFIPLVMPTGQEDERGLSGFEFLMSGTSDPFTRNDQYLIQGQDTNAAQTIRNDLGTATDINGIAFDFSIQHNLVGGRNFTFSLTDTVSSNVSVLCWGSNCAVGSNSAETINGFAPINNYNGLQLQVRAQMVAGSSTSVEIFGLTGVTTTGSPFFNDTVTPTSPGTIPGDFGRRGQWFMADALDYQLNEWELTGRVTLNRTDAALSDRTMVRLAVDFVRNPSLPVPEPSTALLFGLGLSWLGALRRTS